MSVSLEWLAPLETSAVHAAEAVAQGATLTSRDVAHAVKQPAVAMREAIADLGLPPRRLWRRLAALAARIDDAEQLVDAVLERPDDLGANPAAADPATAKSPAAAELTRQLAALFAAYPLAVPNFKAELELRAGPLRQQWEARGPGILRSLQRSLGDRWELESADVLLVYPVLGGGGDAHPDDGSIRIEAVLTDVLPQLPELVRLAWLLACLGAATPHWQPPVVDPWPSDMTPEGCAPQELTVLPAVLSAASQVDLCAYDHATLTFALTAWHLAPNQANETAQALLTWWGE